MENVCERGKERAIEGNRRIKKELLVQESLCRLLPAR